MRKVRTSSLDPIRSMVAFMEADEPMSKPQNDLFTDVPYDGDLVGPTATVHDLLKAKGRRGASAYTARTAPEIGRRAPIDILAGSRGGRIISVAADTNETVEGLRRHPVAIDVVCLA